MMRFVPTVIAAGILAGGVALTPLPSAAQSSYYQNEPTTTGNAWMNENDYDYNRQHMTPPNRPMNRSQSYDNNYSSNNGYDRDYDNNRGYGNRNPDQYRYQQRPYDYGQNRYDPRYDPRYDQRYDQRSYNQPNYGRYQPYNDDD